jgi:hypothetical protein
MYCGPVLRHPAELMLPAVLGGKPCKGGPAARTLKASQTTSVPTWTAF